MTVARGGTPARDLCLALIEAGLYAVRPGPTTSRFVAEHLPKDVVGAYRRLVLMAAGKAAVAMVEAAWDALSGRTDETLIVVPEGYGDGAPRSLRGTPVQIIETSHPLPDERSLEGGAALLARAASLGPDDLGVFLLSGGASACAEALAPGVTLDDARRLTAELLARGAPIDVINAARRKLSVLKGGGLARAAEQSTLFTFALSDVTSGDDASIGSGPSLPAASERHRFYVVADYRAARRGAREAASSLGLVVRDRGDRPLAGEASDLGAALGREARGLHEGECLIEAGEPTVTLGPTPGKGGRNQEVALAAAMALQGAPLVAFASIGTDGRDGPTNAAGALVDGVTVRAPIEAERALRHHDAYPFLERADDLVITGATGTNVADLVVAVRAFED